MNNQSDYGYAIGGIEYRDRKLCATRARACRVLARSEGVHTYPNGSTVDWRHAAREWIAEGKAIRK